MATCRVSGRVYGGQRGGCRAAGRGRMRRRQKKHRLMRGATGGEKVVNAFSIPSEVGATTGGSLSAGLSGAAGGTVGGVYSAPKRRSCGGRGRCLSIYRSCHPRYSSANLISSKLGWRALYRCTVN